MIRPRYAIKLACTKLHSRRVMLAASVVVASLLFAVLIAGIVVFTGAQKSAVQFIQKANDSSYRVEVNPVIPQSALSYSFPLSGADINEIRSAEKEYYAQLRATYKEAGVTYDPSTEVAALTPSAFFPPSTPVDQRFELNHLSPVIGWALDRRLDAFMSTATNKIDALKSIGEKYGASGYYASSPAGIAPIPNAMLIQDGKEDFSDNQMKSGDMTPYGYFTNAVHNSSYQFEDTQLLSRYILPQDPARATQGIPVIISAQEAVVLFGAHKGLPLEPEDASQRSAWLKGVQEKLNGYTYEVCYRNAAEMARIQKVQRDYVDKENNKADKNYRAPSLTYSLPTSPCGEVTVQQDVRTAAEKKSESQVVNDQKELGTYEEPHRQLLTFQVVGLMDAKPSSKYTDNVQSYLQNLLTSDTSSMSAIIPRQQYDALPDALKIDSTFAQKSSLGSMLAGELSTRVLDFRTIDQARDFMDRETCPSSEMNCEKQFTASPYGSNYLILDEIGKLFQKAMLYSMPVILGLAAIIIWFTMVRVMADSRKETAVYRAMGAKRGDIGAIYLLYGMIIAIRIALMSLVVGVLAAFIIDRIYGPGLTSIAQASFGVITDNSFSLFSLTSPLILAVILAVFIVSFIAILQPLVRNVRRNPIKDMRDE